MNQLENHVNLFSALIVRPLVCLLVCVTAWADAPAPGDSARAYLAFVNRACDRVEADLPKVTRVAEIAADRHIKGGILRLPWNHQGLQDELWGRSGGVIHIGTRRPHKHDRSAEEKAQDVAIIGWQRAPVAHKLNELKQLKSEGVYIIGFGPWALPELAEYVDVCDAWFDSGFGSDDRVVELADGSRAGRGNMLVDMLYGWSFIAEYIAALTRRGKMPPVWQAYLYDEGVAWGNKYFRKVQFHSDYEVPPQTAGSLAKRYLTHIRGLGDKFGREQIANTNKAVELILAERREGRKTFCASMGHAPWTFVCADEGKAWGTNVDIHSNLPRQVASYMRDSPDGALVLHVGYYGTDAKALEIFSSKQQRVMYISANTERAGETSLMTGFVIRAVPEDAPVYINMGIAFGDASIELEGYPHRILPSSGVMQLVAYQCVNVEVLNRMGPVPAQ